MVRVYSQPGQLVETAVDRIFKGFHQVDVLSVMMESKHYCSEGDLSSSSCGESCGKSSRRGQKLSDNRVKDPSQVGTVQVVQAAVQ